MKYQSFEEYLMKIHGDQYRGLDDDMPDDYMEWIDKQGPAEIIEHAEHFFKLIGGTHDGQ